MFEVKKTYKHENCLDTQVLVHHVEKRGSDYVLDVDWINFRYGIVIASEHILVRAKDVNYWKEVNKC